jgi:hypothetical protein
MNNSSLTSDEWYWSKQGSDERNGPVSGEKLKELAKEGGLEPEDLVWTKGMDDWKEAGSIEGLDVIPSPSRRVRRRHSKGIFSVASPEQKIELGDAYSFPIEFEVRWGGSVSSTESTLELHRDEVSLHTNDWVNHGGSIDYGRFDITEVGDQKLTVEAPTGFNEDLADKEHNLKFKYESENKKALRVIRYVQGEGFEALLEKIDTGKSLKIEKSKEENWYWIKQGSDERNGPITLERLKELAQEKDLEPEDLVWGSGMSGWTEASSVGKLENSLASPPSFPDDVPSPPLPDDTGDTKGNGDIGYEYKVESVQGVRDAMITINAYAEAGWVLDNFSVYKREGLADVDWFYIVMRREK